MSIRGKQALKEHHVMKTISNVHQRNVGAKGTPRNEGHQ